MKDTPQPTTSTTCQAAYLTPKQAAAYLTVSQRTLWAATTAGRIKAARMGRRIIYSRAELDRFVQLQMLAS